MDESHHPLQCMEIEGSNRAARRLLTVPGVNFWIDSQPLDVGSGGGDIYYLSTCGSGHVSRLALADVSGHGASVDGLARSLRKLMRKYINTLDQTQFARALNHEFANLDADGRFATALIVTYFASTGHLIVCNAGHCRPLWRSAKTRNWRLLDPDSVGECDSLRKSRAMYHFERLANLPLGVIDPTEYEQYALQLEAGDLVALYTDGFIEAEDSTGQALGEDGLLKLFNALPGDDARTLGEQAIAALSARTAGQPATDDRTLVMLEHTATQPPRMSIGRTFRTLAKMAGLIRV
jgi:serine phosphatase RsbU (regulator of sigma subunit)